MKLRLTLVLVGLLVFGTLEIARAALPSAPTPYQVLLRSRQFVPTPGVEPVVRSVLAASTAARHVFVQFNEIPSPDEQRRLVQSGVRLLHYVPDHTWLASFDPIPAKSPDSVSGMRWIGAIN